MTDVLNHQSGWDDFTEDPGRELHASLGRNRCVTDPYEPGSTFKPFIWAVATETGKASPDEVLPCPEHTGWRTSRGRLIRDSHYYGPSTWKKVLVKSMNSGMAMIAERMGHREMQDAIARFGFGHRTYCGIAGESPGIVTTPGQWSHYTQTSVCMGHEIAVTPLQMARAFCAFARDGTLPTLRITAARPWNQEYVMIHRVLSSDMARTVRDAMRDVMVEGTGRKAQSELYEIFGKSGTAQLPKPGGGGYYEDRYVSSFVGGAPFDDPQIVVLCVIDDPDRSINHWGGAIAGPVVRDIIDETLQYLGIPPDKPQPQEPDIAEQVAMAD
jgi:cell division protein FtsI/penicillin-binding protein 2